MLRFKNPYDGCDKTSGHFGFYRQICSNGLHVSQVELESPIRHTKNGIHLVMSKLSQLFDKFLDNEFYSMVPKFNKIKEIKIINTEKFVREILKKTQLFRYECSDTNPDPSKKAREVIKILNQESIFVK